MYARHPFFLLSYKLSIYKKVDNSGDHKEAAAFGIINFFNQIIDEVKLKVSRGSFDYLIEQGHPIIAINEKPTVAEKEKLDNSGIEYHIFEDTEKTIAPLEFYMFLSEVILKQGAHSKGLLWELHSWLLFGVDVTFYVQSAYGHDLESAGDAALIQLQAAIELRGTPTGLNLDLTSEALKNASIGLDLNWAPDALVDENDERRLNTQITKIKYRIENLFGQICDESFSHNTGDVLYVPSMGEFVDNKMAAYRYFDEECEATVVAFYDTRDKIIEYFKHPNDGEVDLRVIAANDLFGDPMGYKDIRSDGYYALFTEVDDSSFKRIAERISQ